MANPAADYPAALHTNTDVSGFSSSKLGSTSPTHTALEGKQEEEILAAQTKIGTGASTPTANKVLRGTGVGTSAWGGIVVADLDTGVLDTDLTSVSGSDDTLPSAKATKTYADTKEPSISSGTTGQYWRGDKSWQTLDKTAVGLGSVTNDAQLKAASNLSDLANAATARTNLGVDAAGTDNSSKASIAETNTGTSTTKVVTPDGLAGSYAGTKTLSVYVIEGATSVTTGDGKAYIRVPTALDGMNLIMCNAAVIGKSTSGTPTIQLARGRQSSPTAAHTFADMLSTRITIDANEFDSKDATTPPVIDTANDDILAGDLIRVDIDVAGTGTTGLIVTMSFQLP